MRDRFPLLVVGSLLLSVILGSFLLRGASRGGFADALSTYRASEDGARALYVLGQESGLPVVRRSADLQVMDAKSHATVILLAVEVGARARTTWMRPCWPPSLTRDWRTRTRPTRASTPCTPRSSTTTSGRSCSRT